MYLPIGLFGVSIGTSAMTAPILKETSMTKLERLLEEIVTANRILAHEGVGGWSGGGMRIISF